MRDSKQAYHGLAIGLHWIIAILIIGMLAVGKYMVGLDESDPLRFTLTQWHKSFGIFAMLLILLRLSWRLFNRPPAPPQTLKPWENRAAHAAHWLLYALMVVIPVSGWIMVSASPLELPTLLFNAIHWPHLAPFYALANKAEIARLFVEIHELAGTAMIVLLLAHIAAALRHRFVLRDDVMLRMSPKTRDGKWSPGFLSVSLIVTTILAALLVYAFSASAPPPLAATGPSQVQFDFTVQNQGLSGSFRESSVELFIDRRNPLKNSLSASVNVPSVATGNSQIDTTILASDWFDANNHALASFESTKVTPVEENSYSVSGTLTIKDLGREVSFPLQIENLDTGRTASGSFSVNRLDFELGKNSQPTDKTVAFDVTINFRFEIE